jgi:hypothetical protein
MRVEKLVAAVLVVLGLVLLLKSLAATWFVLLVVAAALALGAATKVIGKWGFAAAGLCIMVAVPGFVLSFAFRGLSLALRLVKMAPFVLVVVGLYMLVKSSGRKP